MVATIRRAITQLLERVRVAESGVNAGTAAVRQLDHANSTITALQDVVTFLEARVSTLQVREKGNAKPR